MRTVNPLSTDWYRCLKCKMSFFVDSNDDNKHLLKATMRCPNYLTCKGNIRLRQKWPDSGIIPGPVRNLTALELYHATSGIGFPEERRCAPEQMTKIMTGARIYKVHLEKSPDPQKSVLMSMTLDNGKVIHLTTSTKGALIYKITEAGNGR